MRVSVPTITSRVLLKLAGEVITPLLPHQQRVLDRLQNSPGLVVAHGLGTGKTLSSIAAGESADNPLAMVPASLVSNYEKELSKHVKGKHKTKVQSYQTAILRNQLTPTDLLIIDEAHRAREPSTKMYQYFMDYPAEKRLLLTGSPVYNRPRDIATLVNMAAHDRVLPVGTEFDKRFVEKPDARGLMALMPWSQKEPHLKNTKQLKKVLQQWVDYHDSMGQDFPEKIEKRIDVEMSPRQTQLHDFAWDKLPWMTRMRLRAGLPPEKQDVSRINQFEAQSRQIGGSLKRFQKNPEESPISPKLQRAVSELKAHMDNPQYKAVVYSNYLDTLADYGKALDDANIPYDTFTGVQSQRKRKQMVDDYNQNKIRALLVSSAGGEGLDLKGTRQIQVLEPHWNEEKLNQVIGRAIRHQSHSDLPEDERNVEVQRYMAYPKPGAFSKLINRHPLGIEQVLYNLSQNKTKLNEELLDLLK